MSDLIPVTGRIMCAPHPPAVQALADLAARLGRCPTTTIGPLADGQWLRRGDLVITPHGALYMVAEDGAAMDIEPQPQPLAIVAAHVFTPPPPPPPQ